MADLNETKVMCRTSQYTKPRVSKVHLGNQPVSLLMICRLMPQMYHRMVINSVRYQVLNLVVVLTLVCAKNPPVNLKFKMNRFLQGF